MDDIIVLINEEGAEERFEILDYISEGGKDYACLCPEDDEDGRVIIMVKTGENGTGDDVYEDWEIVTDGDLAQKIFDIFRGRNQDIYDFDD